MAQEKEGSSMERLGTRRLALVLRLLVLVVFVVNLLVLPLVPGISALLADGGPNALKDAVAAALALPGYEGTGVSSLPLFFTNCLWAVWAVVGTGEVAPALLTVFFWLCGTCTALILWQAKKVLDTILKGEPFQMSNARALRQAAMCCWVISGAALARLIWEMSALRNLAPLFTYNALFIPAFFMGGLLFLVMSALFRQAAELKEDQDLTI